MARPPTRISRYSTGCARISVLFCFSEVFCRCPAEPRATRRSSFGHGGGLAAMNSSMIGKIEKAHRYAREPERIRFSTFEATFQGGHDTYHVALQDDHCTCSGHTY